MSVNINWNSLEQESLLDWSRKLLHDALNSGKRPSVLASEIDIQDLHFGANAPIVEILEIGDLASDRFRGIFKIKYTGDLHIDLSTRIQANPMNVFCAKLRSQNLDFALPTLSLTNQNFTIPITLKLLKIVLSGIVIVVFIKSKGLTLVFKNDPLESIAVSSTFDAVPSIRNFLQNQIENQIRDLFREILPSILYKVSQRWTNSIHTQLLTSSKPDQELIMLKDVNPDGPDVAPGNVIRAATLCASRRSLAIDVPQIRDFIQRSTVDKYLRTDEEVFDNGLPAGLFSRDFSVVEKAITDVGKYQLMSYNRIQNNNKTVKKPKRRVIKLGGKKPREPEQPVENETSSVCDTESSETTCVEDEETAEQKLRNRRALSLSSASVEYLRSLYLKEESKSSHLAPKEIRVKETKPEEKPKESKYKEAKKTMDIKAAKPNKLRKPYIIPLLANEKGKQDALRSPLNDPEILNLSLGLNRVYGIGLENKKEPVSFFTANSLDIPPPYVP